MRDPKRIKKFCDELAEIWENECPDWRFTQLILNVFRANNMNDAVAFYTEDSRMMEDIKSFFHVDER